jgi:catechol 2,3-dioxygenase-like lactoylglutathione lyase family enzyme
MPLTGLELHHHAVRMRPDAGAATLAFYRDVLGLEPDPGARKIPDVEGYWLDCANDTQLHVFGVEGVSKYARAEGEDPFTPHVAFGCPDVAAARAELDRAGVRFWSAGRDERQQLFLTDTNGNMIELHQIGTCRCRRSTRPQP